MYDEDPDLPKPDYMAGDFNMVEDAFDRASGRSNSNAVVDALWDLNLRFGLQDAYRTIHPTAQDFTYHKFGTQDTWSRIDRGYLTLPLIPYVLKVIIEEAGIGSDHKMLVIEVECRKAPYIGKGRWSMPLRLLKDPKVIKAIEELGHEALAEIDGIQERSDEHNPQLVIRDFKAKAKIAIRNHDKKMTQVNINKTIDRLVETKEELVRSGRLDTATLSEIDKKIRKGVQLKHNKHRTAVQATDFLRGGTPGRYMTSQNRPKAPKEIIVRLQKLPDMDEERARRHARRLENNPEDKQPINQDDAQPVMELDHETNQERDRQRQQAEADRYLRRSEDMAEEMAMFHENLQTQDPPESPEAHQTATRDACGFVTNRLSEDQAQQLKVPATKENLRDTLRLTKNNSAPGADGLPYEFWKRMVNIAAEKERKGETNFDALRLLTAVFNDVENHGHCSAAGLNEGVMCPIFKKGDRSLCKNYRPITLLNTDYKLYTKFRALQLAEVIGEIVPIRQAGFIPGRSIYNNIALTRMIIAYAEAYEINGAIVLLDQEKAYDKVDLRYLWAVVREFGIPEEWVRPVESLYEEATSRVIINGVASEPFRVYRGVRQGDPLSCLLFVLAIEPLAEMLRQSDLKGFEIPDSIERLIATLFADDTTVYLSEDDDFQDLTTILNRWCKASRARFNIEKSEVIPVGTKVYRTRVLNERRLKSEHPPIPADVLMVKDNDARRSLGGRIGNALSTDAIWTQVMNKLDGRLSFWANKDRYPELRSRKMFTDWLTSGMTLFLTAAQGMPQLIEKAISKRQLAFFWKGKKGPTVNQMTLSRSKLEGGVGIIHIAWRNDAVRLMRLKALVAKDSTWGAFALKLVARTLGCAG
ncbi:unnamed protein product [Peniophora sp. CBMAI 1063]|nr:unnamed protein product [Peniophora sp. CBMAI 1063]